MREPSQESVDSLRTLVKHQFPQSVVLEMPTDTGTETLVITIHGSGSSEAEALSNALSCWNEMISNGRALRGALDEILDDLRKPGMSSERHGQIHESLTLCEGFLNDGVLTNTIGWIEVPSLTREIADIRRRVDARLGATAADMAAYEVAKKKAAEPADHDGAADSYLSVLDQVRGSRKGAAIDWSKYPDPSAAKARAEMFAKCRKK